MTAGTESVSVAAGKPTTNWLTWHCRVDCTRTVLLRSETLDRRRLTVWTAESANFLGIRFTKFNDQITGSKEVFDNFGLNFSIVSMLLAHPMISINDIKITDLATKMSEVSDFHTTVRWPVGWDIINKTALCHSHEHALAFTDDPGKI